MHNKEHAKKILDFYSKPGKLTDVGKYKDQIKKLPPDIKDLVYIVQGLLIHQYVASPFYKVKLSKEQEEEAHIRPVEKLLDGILSRVDKPLDEVRKPKDRLVGVCRHFHVLMVAILRAKGIPARARYGYGDYFNPGYFEDHSLVEYWSEKEKRWILVDPQFDKVWQKELHIKHDVFDVPRNHFLVAADAWIKCRNSEADPSKFGIFKGDFRGLWFIAGDLVHDVASLNKMEMLEWDGWGATPRPNNQMKDKKRLEFFDGLSELTKDPDESFEEIIKIYKDKKNRLLVPERVFNGLHGHLEKI